MNTPEFKNIMSEFTAEHFGPKIQSLITKIISKTPEMKLGELFDDLQAQNPHLLAALRDVDFNTLKVTFNPPAEVKEGKKTRVPKANRAVAIENWTDEKVQAQYQGEILKYLEGQAGGTDGRGVSKKTIREEIKHGSGKQFDEAMKALFAAKKIGSTGEARGLRLVVTSLLPAAQTAYAAQQAAKAAAAQKKTA